MPARSVKKRRKSRKQIGGAVFTPAQLAKLDELGFTAQQKDKFSQLLETQAASQPQLPSMVITAARFYLRSINPQTGQNRTPQEFIDDEIEAQNNADKPFGGKRRRKTRKQRGGTRFSEAQLTELDTLGFNDKQKNELTEHLGELLPNNAMDLIRLSLRQINPRTGRLFTPQELIDSLDDDEEPRTPPRREGDQRGGTNFTHVKNELNNLGIVEDDDIRKLTQFYTVGPNDAIDTIRHYLRITYPGQVAPYTRAQIRAFIQTLSPEHNNDLSDIENDSDDEHNLSDSDDEEYWNILNSVDGGKRKRKSRKQRGGTNFSNEQNTELGALGFTDEQKSFLRDHLTFTPEAAMIRIQNELQRLSPAQTAPYTQAQIRTVIQTLNNNAVRGTPARIQPVARPVQGDEAGGGGRRRKTRKSRKTRKNRKMKGGARYGTGVGANNFDPNFSIYNTPALSLFPYKPT